MNDLDTERSPAQTDSAITAIQSLEQEISNTVRGDRLTNRFTKFTPRIEEAAESNGMVGGLEQNLGATSIGEIDKLISELHAARNYLKAEADRIQQDLARFRHLDDTALASVKIITESLGQWRNSKEALGVRKPPDAA